MVNITKLDILERQVKDEEGLIPATVVAKGDDGTVVVEFGDGTLVRTETFDGRGQSGIKITGTKYWYRPDGTLMRYESVKGKVSDGSVKSGQGSMVLPRPLTFGSLRRNY